MVKPTTKSRAVPGTLPQRLADVVEARKTYLDLAIDLYTDYPELDVILSDAKREIKGIRMQVREEGIRR